MSDTASFLNAGWHPNDGSLNWLGGMPSLDSKVVFDFMNGFAGSIPGLLHSVNRLEVTARAPSGYFLLTILEKGMLNSGPVAVVRTTSRNGLSEDEAFYREVPQRPNETTRAWLTRVYGVLMEGASLVAITIPTDPSAWFGDSIDPETSSPEYVTQMGQPGASPDYS